MAPRKDHSLHEKRAGRNIVTLIALIVLVGLVGALTIVKIRTTGFVEAYDHVVRPVLSTPGTQGQGGAQN